MSKKRNSNRLSAASDAPAKAANGGSTGSGDAASPRLESKVNNRTHESPRVVFFPCNCKCKTCDRCGGRYGYKVRQGLLAKAGMFRRPLLLTLTIDRNAFADPESSHKFVSDNGRIRLLMRKLGVELWFWVLEFQEKSGTGWPHWHLLIDLWDVPGKRIDLTKAWAVWRDSWGLGSLDLQIRRDRFKNPEHAILYVTKYMIKRPKIGYPLWLLETERRIRFFQGSGKLGAILDSSRSSNSSSTDKPKRRRAQSRPYIERMAECAHSATVLYETIDPITGGPYRQFIGTLNIAPDRLAALGKLIGLRSPVLIEHHHAEWEGGEQFSSRPYMLAASKNEAKKLVEALERELFANNEVSKNWRVIAERMERIRSRNVFGQREAAERGSDDQG